MEVRRNGNYEQWIKFFIKAVIIAAEDSINVINKFLEMREKNLAKIMTLGKSSKTVESLQELGILKQTNNLMRNRCFAYVEYLDKIR